MTDDVLGLKFLSPDDDELLAGLLTRLKQSQVVVDSLLVGKEGAVKVALEIARARINSAQLLISVSDAALAGSKAGVYGNSDRFLDDLLNKETSNGGGKI